MSIGEAAASSRHARAALPLPVDIDLEHVGFVNYALAQNGVSPARRLVVTAHDEALTDVRISVSIVDVTGRSLATPWERTLGEIPAGTSVTFETIDLTPDPSALVDIEEHRPGRLIVEVVDDDREARRDEDITV